MSNLQDMETAPDSPAKKSSEAADPAPTKEQDHQDSMPDSTAAAASTGSTQGPSLPTAAEIIREAMGHRLRAEELLRDADPIAVELHELGYRLGLEEGERRAGERAARRADRFLDYLAEDPNATPGPIPPLQARWVRDAA